MQGGQRQAGPSQPHTKATPELPIPLALPDCDLTAFKCTSETPPPSACVLSPNSPWRQLAQGPLSLLPTYLVEPNLLPPQAPCVVSSSSRTWESNQSRSFHTPLHGVSMCPYILSIRKPHIQWHNYSSRHKGHTQEDWRGLTEIPTCPCSRQPYPQVTCGSSPRVHGQEMGKDSVLLPGSAV